MGKALLQAVGQKQEQLQGKDGMVIAITSLMVSHTSQAKAMSSTRTSKTFWPQSSLRHKKRWLLFVKFYTLSCY